MTDLQDLMISRVRVKLLKLFFAGGEDMYYVREITRLIKEEINAVRRELDRMVGFGLLKSEQRGNRLYYRLNSRYLFFNELKQMVAKTVGLGKKIRKAKRKLGEVNFVIFSSKFVLGKKPAKDEVEVFVVGTVVLKELDLLIKEEEKVLKREINYTVLSKEEFEFRKVRRDPFVMEILLTPYVMVIGDAVEFAQRKTPGLT